MWIKCYTNYKWVFCFNGRFKEKWKEATPCLRKENQVLLIKQKYPKKKVTSVIRKHITHDKCKKVTNF